MRTIKTIFAVAGLIFLTSCSFIEDPKSVLPDDVSFSKCDEILNNSDEIISKSYKPFSFDENCTVIGDSNVYKLTLGYCDPDMDKAKLKEKGEKIAKELEGDAFDTTLGSIVSDFRYEYRSDDSYYGTDLYDGLYIGDESILDGYLQAKGENSFSNFYDFDKCTLNDICSIKSNKLLEALNDCKGKFTLEPKYLFKYQNNDEHLYIYGAYNYNGINIDYNISPNLNESDKENVFFLDSSYDMILNENGEPQVFWSSSRTPRVVSEEKITELISFEGAVNILNSELAENSGYVFDKCELMYCYIKTQPVIEIDDFVPNAAETFEYEPTWVFYIKQDEKNFANYNSPSTIRVNALTGNTTIAIYN